ncbi:MAG TPA: HXXEE domain-containing protein, partial [Opitutales bacterium]|nr:HXXEE domain-containing protein [Opitutales bacterium]
VVTAAAFVRPRGGFLTLFEVVTGCVFLHAFVHAAQAVLLRGYVPGLFGAMLFVVPMNLVLYRALIRARILPLSRAFLTALVGLLLFVPFVVAAKALAGFVR